MERDSWVQEMQKLIRERQESQQQRLLAVPGLAGSSGAVSPRGVGGAPSPRAPAPSPRGTMGSASNSGSFSTTALSPRGGQPASPLPSGPLGSSPSASSSPPVIGLGSSPSASLGSGASSAEDREQRENSGGFKSIPLNPFAWNRRA
jgi:hypothetical protein